MWLILTPDKYITWYCTCTTFGLYAITCIANNTDCEHKLVEDENSDNHSRSNGQLSQSQCNI